MAAATSKAGTAKPAKAKTVAPKKAAAKRVAPRTASLNPYLMFDGKCEAAFKFYAKVFGTKIDHLYRFKDIPPSEPKMDAKFRNRILHASMMVGPMILMGADGCPKQPPKAGDNVVLSICAPSPAEAKRIFKALALRGKVAVPLAKTFWAELFGQATDRFGITWMVNFSEE